MIGNIREWVADCWHADYEGAPTDGSAWTTDCASAQGVVKGGAYKSSNTKDLRASVRLPFDPAAMDESVGFRCCQRLCDCSIDGQCYQEGQTNPANECQRCTAAVSRLAWTAGPDGVVCGDDLRCAAGECACVPDCAGKECGEDGCGGSCGACSPGLGCHEDWTCGETMILIESGPFWMGCNAAVDKECDGDDEVPYREITLSAYEIDATEVAWGAYEVCDLTGPCSVTYPGKAPDHPINYMTWQQANTYCTWAGKRLCTEAEWEKAARGTDGRKYPWGNQPPTCEIANTSSCGIEVKPVGTHPLGASPYGVQDMGGSLKEWTADWYDPYYYTYGPTTDPKGLPSGSFKAVRGANKGRTSDRSTGALSSTAWDYGFRCCRSVAQ
jgi:formylglycine-generating enzyme required for sulfatase activity